LEYRVTPTALVSEDLDEHRKEAHTQCFEVKKNILIMRWHALGQHASLI
jgi:hypothetical protein